MLYENSERRIRSGDFSDERSAIYSGASMNDPQPPIPEDDSDEAFYARAQRSKERHAATGISHSTDEVIDRQLAKIEQRRREVLGADARRELEEGRADRFESVDGLLEDLKREDD